MTTIILSAIADVPDRQASEILERLGTARTQ